METSTVYSETSQAVVWCALSRVSSFWFYILLVLWLKFSKSTKAEITEEQSLFLWKVVPGILIQATYVVRVSTFRNNVKIIVVRVIIPHCYKIFLTGLSTYWSCDLGNLMKLSVTFSLSSKMWVLYNKEFGQAFLAS